MSKADMTLGFAGIGLMGLPMCRRLLAAGYPLTVWNRNRDKCAPLQAEGAAVVATPAELAQHCDVLILCLADTSAVCEVTEAVLPALQKGQIIIDCSSIEPQATRELAARVVQHGAHWLDVPVSGGVGGAENGSLTLMAGGAADVLARVEPVLMQLGQRLTHMGPTGSGQVTKICNQMLVACNAMVIAEVVALAQRAGVDAELLTPALTGGFADSKPLQILAPQMASRTFEPVRWHVRTLLKDLDMAASLSREQGSATPMSGIAAQLMRMHAAAGSAGRDPSTLIELYSRAEPCN